jgi:hypothetical protein
MPATIEAVRAYATLGEICSSLRDVYGVYEEPAFYYHHGGTENTENALVDNLKLEHHHI